MKLCFVTWGTKGDIHPIINLSKFAIRDGFHVTIFAHEKYKNVIEANGCKFHSIRRIHQAKEIQLSEIRDVEIINDLRKQRENLKVDLADILYKHFQIDRPDLVILMNLTFPLLFVCQKLKIKCALLSLCPFLPSESFFNLSPELNTVDSRFILDSNSGSSSMSEWELWWKALNYKFDHGKPKNLMSHVLYFNHQKEFYNRINEMIDLPKFELVEFLYLIMSNLPVINCWLYEFLSPKNYNNSSLFSCQVDPFCISSIPDNTSFINNKPLQAFIKNKCFCVTFGSMNFQGIKEAIEICTNALLENNEKVLIMSGNLDFSDHHFQNNPNILILQEMDHAIIFPHLKGIIFHGGAGTLQMALNFSVPTLVIPSIGDQLFFSSQLLENLPCGPLPLSLHLCDQFELKLRVKQLVENAEHYSSQINCKNIKINTERSWDTLKNFFHTIPDQSNSFSLKNVLISQKFTVEEKIMFFYLCKSKHPVYISENEIMIFSEILKENKKPMLDSLSSFESYFGMKFSDKFKIEI